MLPPVQKLVATFIFFFPRKRKCKQVPPRALRQPGESPLLWERSPEDCETVEISGLHPVKDIPKDVLCFFALAGLERLNYKQVLPSAYNQQVPGCSSIPALLFSMIWYNSAIPSKAQMQLYRITVHYGFNTKALLGGQLPIAIHDSAFLCVQFIGCYILNLVLYRSMTN